MIEWAFKGKPQPGFDALLDCYLGTEFDSPTRSTIPLLQYWRTPEPRLAKLRAALHLPLPDPVLLDFEHKVYPRRGRGRASHTDVMLTSPSLAVAIEAKWTEPRYEVVETWLGDSPNRRDVLQAWFDLLERCGAGPLRPGHVLELPYQMIHRAASACSAESASNPWLLYFVFDPHPSTRSEYLTDLRGLRDALGSRSSLGIMLVECAIEKTPVHARLQARWDAGERALHAPVLDALRSGELINVRLEHAHCLTG